MLNSRNFKEGARRLWKTKEMLVKILDDFIVFHIFKVEISDKYRLIHVIHTYPHGKLVDKSTVDKQKCGKVENDRNFPPTFNKLIYLNNPIIIVYFEVFYIFHIMWKTRWKSDVYNLWRSKISCGLI